MGPPETSAPSPVQVDALIVLITQLAGAQPLSRLDEQVWDNRVRLLNQQHQSHGAVAPEH